MNEDSLKTLIEVHMRGHTYYIEPRMPREQLIQAIKNRIEVTKMNIRRLERELKEQKGVLKILYKSLEILEGKNIKVSNIEIDFFDSIVKKGIKLRMYPCVKAIFFETDSGLYGRIGVDEDADIYIAFHDHAVISAKGKTRKNPIITIEDDEYSARFKISMTEGK